MKIRKITPDATVTTFAGTNGSLGNLLNGDVSMAVDRDNTIWLFNQTSLYTITSNGIISMTNLAIGISSGMCMDSNGKFYLSIGNQIYQYNTNGSASVFVGSGNSGAIDGNGAFTSFSSPKALACDSANNIYVWDSGNYLIRRIDQSRNVVTIAGHNGGPNEPIADGVGTNASFAGTGILAMCADNSGNIYFACGNSIRKMNAKTNVVTMAGSFTQSGYTNGAGNLARFNGSAGICFSGGTIYVSDSANYRIRQISFNPQSQVVSGANLGIGTFAGVTITGAVGRTYQIQSSPDMNAWTTRATLLLNSSPYLWIDQNPVSGNKFYRALLLP
jgi:sugar lactone lactonase YvrE